MVAMPKKADTHIQKMAPGPPEASAVAQPVMLPVPTWAATAVVSAWKLLMPSLPAALPLRLKPLNRFFMPVPNRRTCTKPSRRVKKMPVPSSRNKSRLSHKKLLAMSIAWLN